MKIENRLKLYFLEADKHIEKLKKAKIVLQKFYPFNIDTLEELEETEKDKLDVLIFRFSKLQDLMGEKIFRYYFEFSGRNTEIPFVKLISELERENMIDVEKWRELRLIRNSIANEYPYDESNLIEAINKFLENIDYLIYVKEKIEKIVNENK